MLALFLATVVSVYIPMKRAFIMPIPILMRIYGLGICSGGGFKGLAGLFPFLTSYIRTIDVRVPSYYSLPLNFVFFRN